MANAQTCAQCDAPLPAGVSDVFCPACAFRRALAVGGDTLAPPANWFVGFLRRWRTRAETEPAGEAREERATPLTSMNRALPNPGDVIEDYEILESVGGHMGLVFKARHRRLEKVVAIKLLPVDLTNDADKARLARFQREIRVMGPLEHPNLVTASDARQVKDWHLVVMEWIEGIDLQRLLRAHGALTVADACEVARQAALGLQYAHANGLIHRDVKPSNLMLTRAGTIKVIDLGLALAREDNTAVQLTRAGDVMGTIAYCAPEQLRDASNVDTRADLYSLGCTLFHLLTGRAPYGRRSAVTEVVQAHLNEPFPSLIEAQPQAPPELEAVLARMTAKDREARFATPGEVAAALEPFTKGADLKLLVPASEPHPRRTVISGKSPASGRPGVAVTLPARARWMAIAAVLVGLGIAAAAFFSTIAGAGRRSISIIDTSAERGVYDEENRRKGANNAEEIKKVLRTLPLDMQAEAISIRAFDRDWGGEARVLALHPDLVLIHRSCFFHPLNAEMKFGYPPFTNAADQARWDVLYRMGDDKLISFMSVIAMGNPRTKFLVYSRGTDENWKDTTFREVTWINDIVARCPALQDRITSVLIPGGTNGSFRNPGTANSISNHVVSMMQLR